MAETSKERTDRIMGMGKGALVLHAMDLTYQRDELRDALQSVVDFLDGVPDAIEPVGVARSALAKAVE